MKPLNQFLTENKLTKTRVKNWLKKEKCYNIIKHKIYFTQDCEDKIVSTFFSKMKNNDRMDFDVLNNMDREFAYLLGFIWSDGFVSKDNNYVVSLSIEENDYKDIETVINKHILWEKRKILDKKRPNGKPQIRSYVYNKKIHNFFVKLNYQYKSFNDFNKVKDFIQKNLLKYFIRGLIDGDGCFYVNYKTKKYQKFIITNNSNYDWTSFCDILKEINITKYHLLCNNKNGSKNSNITINSIYDIIKLGDFIYENKYDGVGLKRKYLKYCEIKNKFLSSL